MLLQLLRNLGFHFIQRRQLGVTHIVYADDVEAKLGFNRGLGHLTFFQLGHGGREFGHIAASCSPVQVAAVGAGAWIFRRFFGQLFKAAAFFDLGNQGQGFLFFFHQNVARVEFLAAVGRNKLVVFRFDFGIGDRVLLLEVGKQLANQDRLASQLELVFVVFCGIQTALAGFLNEHFAGDQFFFDLAHHFRGDRSA